MKNKFIFFTFIIVFCLALSGCSGTSQSSTDKSEVSSETVEDTKQEMTQESEGNLIIAAAASLKDVMEDLQNEYTGNCQISVTFGGSGALQTQIEEGAPVDLFISAAEKQMNALEEKNLINSDTRTDLLKNKVVLITPKDNPKNIQGFDKILEKADNIGLGEPSSVPVGQYSEEIFTSMSILDDIKQKAVYGNDVRTVLTWVETGEVDCGVVYSTDAAISQDIEIIEQAPEGSCQDVIYPAAVIKDCENVQNANDFLEFLKSDEAKTIFEKYGFERLE